MIPIKEDPSCYISKTQQEILGLLSRINIITNHFFITGGTALAVFYIHHRYSEDIELFTIDFRDLAGVDIALKRIFQKDLSLIQSSDDFYQYLIRGVKVDIVFDHLSIKTKRYSENLEMGSKIKVDSMDNISSNKLSAMASRFESKDMIDFYYISKMIWKDDKRQYFFECYEMAREKEALLDDPAMAAYQIEELLNQIVDRKSINLPPMREEVDLEDFENEMRGYINIIYGMQKW